MDATQNYIKYFYVLANIVLTVVVLAAGSFIISPLIAAFIIAILLNPLYTRFIKLGIPRILSALVSVLLFLLIIIAFISFITTQLRNITADPALSADSFTKIISSTQTWITSFFDYSLTEQTQFIEKSINDFIKKAFAYLPNAFRGTTTFLSTFFFFIISLFFFLYYNDFFMSFIYKMSGKGNKDRVKVTATKIKNSIKNYIVGLFIVVIIVATLNSLGLLVLGIGHAVFFGILAGVLTIIPYIGILVGSLLPIMFAFASTDSLWYPLAIIVLFSLVQFLEGNFLTPYIIGSQQNINPYVAILGLLFGGLLLGMVGIILAIPLLGIVKIICDDIESLKPIGYVMGNPHRV